MEWLFILVLGGVAVWQGARIGALSRRVAELEKQLRVRAAEAPEAGAATSTPSPAPAEEDEPLLLTEAMLPGAREPLLLDRPIADDELVLDTPLPEPSNDGHAPAAATGPPRPPAQVRPAGADLTQAIGAAAVLLALAAPVLVQATFWPSLALTLYIALAGAGGFTLAALQRWGWTALVTLVGLYCWYWTSITADEYRRALAILSFASFGAVALSLQPPLAEAPSGWLTWRRVHALSPTLGIAVSSAFLVVAWGDTAPSPAGAVAGPALISVFHVALAAYAVRGRVATPPALIVAIAALLLGFVAHLRTRFYLGPLGADFYPIALVAALAIILCTGAAQPHRRWRVQTTAAGAIGAALLFSLAASTRDNWHAPEAWAALFGGAAVLFTAAWRTAHRAAPSNARVIDFWAGAGAALVLLGAESAFPAEARTGAHAAVSLMFASAFVWRGWRALRWAALAAAIFALANALSPNLVDAALAGAIPIWGALLILIVAAVLLFGAAFTLWSYARSRAPVALAVSGFLLLLIGVYLLLRWLGIAPGAAGTLAIAGGCGATIAVLRFCAPGLYAGASEGAANAARAAAGRTSTAFKAGYDGIRRVLGAGPKPTDLVNVTPGARRDRRYGRRQRSQ